MLFTVVTTTYNVGGKLPGTVESVRAQGFPEGDYEHIVVDGGSTDGTLDWLRAHEGPTLRWVSEPDRGIFDAMNKGIRLARGEYLYFIGAGDRLRPGVFAALAPLLTGEPAARRPEFVHGDIFWEARNCRWGGPYNRFKMAVDNMSHQAVFYHRSLFARFGEYNLRYPVTADWAFNMQLFGRREVRKRYVNLLMADFEAGGISGSQRDLNFEHDYVSLVRQHLGWLPWLYYRRMVFLRPAVLFDAVRRRFARANARL